MRRGLGAGFAEVYNINLPPVVENMEGERRKDGEFDSPRSAGAGRGADIASTPQADVIRPERTIVATFLDGKRTDPGMDRKPYER